MSDVRETDAPAARSGNQPNPPGDFIWYELMTTDPEAAKAFYDAVVGWTISEGAPEYGGYRMIGTADGRVMLRDTDEGDDPVELGRRLARHLLDDAGGASLLADMK